MNGLHNVPGPMNVKGAAGYLLSTVGPDTSTVRGRGPALVFGSGSSVSSTGGGFAGGGFAGGAVGGGFTGGGFAGGGFPGVLAGDGFAGDGLTGGELADGGLAGALLGDLPAGDSPSEVLPDG